MHNKSNAIFHEIHTSSCSSKYIFANSQFLVHEKSCSVIPTRKARENRLPEQMISCAYQRIKKTSTFVVQSMSDSLYNMVRMRYSQKSKKFIQLHQKLYESMYCQQGKQSEMPRFTQKTVTRNLKSPRQIVCALFFDVLSHSRASLMQKSLRVSEFVCLKTVNMIAAYAEICLDTSSILGYMIASGMSMLQSSM